MPVSFGTSTVRKICKLIGDGVRSGEYVRVIDVSVRFQSAC